MRTYVNDGIEVSEWYPLKLCNYYFFFYRVKLSKESLRLLNIYGLGIEMDIAQYKNTILD